ncbi:hypothetical protein ACFWN2_34700 [Lentzea sp. NPDC058436]|uniref:hypothetical protein n=1 Tax=Lentzea sp. NPDC058436 TaxID=3346499 RepID=UPI00365C46E1
MLAAVVTVPAAEVLLIGEVFFRSTKVNELVLKSQVCAEAGISYYLIIDPARAISMATLFELEEGAYVAIA